jgi:hypothetical protein
MLAGLYRRQSKTKNVTLKRLLQVFCRQGVSAQNPDAVYCQALLPWALTEVHIICVSISTGRTALLECL